jgi:putative endonuclease
MKTAKRAFGDWGETIAETFLRRKGYKIIKRNYRVKRGELDIIAWHTKRVFAKTLCFIEVKSRRGERGGAERATGPEKQHRMQQAAMHWCLEHKIPTDRTPIQFEQISVYDTGIGTPEIFHYILPVS